MRRFPHPIDHCYILCNPEKEPDRIKYLTTWLAENEIDPSCYTIGVDCYGTDPFFQTAEVWKVYDPWSTQHGRRLANGTSTNLKAGELSLILNFVGAAKKAVAAGHKTVMILESDVLFFDDFLGKFEKALAALDTEPMPKDGWDFLSLSASAKLVPERGDAPVNQQWFRPINSYFHTRCTDSMVFRVDMLAKILQTILPCAEPLDWELNFQLSIHRSRSFWLDPPIMKQGSGAAGPYDTLL
jgi:hypothetical protein